MKQVLYCSFFFFSSSKLPNCFLHSSSGLTVSKLFLVKNDLREHQNTRREKCWITESWRCGKMRRMPWLKRFTTTVYNPSEVLRTLQFVTTWHDIFVTSSTSSASVKKNLARVKLFRGNEQSVFFPRCNSVEKAPRGQKCKNYPRVVNKWKFTQDVYSLHKLSV